MSDNINHPSHYADGWSNGSEVIDITENLNFNRGNAVKYLARAGRKRTDTELEDLFKAQWYINREIKRVEAANEARTLEDLKFAAELFKSYNQSYANFGTVQTPLDTTPVPDGSLESDYELAELRDKLAVTPCVWDRVEDIPTDVSVTDHDGDVATYNGSEWWIDNDMYRTLSVNEDGPFTEVIA